MSNPWTTVDLVSAPEFPGEHHATAPGSRAGALQTRRADERVVATALSLEAADWVPPRVRGGTARVSCLGFTDEFAPAQWRPVGATSSAEPVLLCPVLQGATANVEIELGECPSFMDGVRILVAIRHVASGGGHDATHRGTVLVQGNRAQLAAPLPPGAYEIFSDVLKAPVLVHVPASAVPPTLPVTGEGTCVPLTCLAVSVRDGAGHPIRSFGVRLSVAGYPLRGRTKGLESTRGQQNYILGIRCIGTSRRPGEARYLLREPPTAVRVHVSALGRRFVADDAVLEPGTLNRLETRFR